VKYDLDVTYLDSRKVRTSATPRDFVNFERQFAQSVTAFRNGAAVKYEWLCYLAWSSLHRAGKEPADFDSFLDTVEDVDPVEDEPELPDPTQPDQSPEPS